MNRTYCHKLCIYQVGDINCAFTKWVISSICPVILFLNKKDGKGHETIQSSATPDAGYHMEK